MAYDTKASHVAIAAAGATAISPTKRMSDCVRNICLVQTAETKYRGLLKGWASYLEEGGRLLPA